MCTHGNFGADSTQAMSQGDHSARSWSRAVDSCEPHPAKAGGFCEGHRNLIPGGFVCFHENIQADLKGVCLGARGDQRALSSVRIPFEEQVVRSEPTQVR